MAPEGAKSIEAERRQRYHALSIAKLHIYTLHLVGEYSRNITFGKKKLHLFHKSVILAQIKRRPAENSLIFHYYSWVIFNTCPLLICKLLLYSY